MDGFVSACSWPHGIALCDDRWFMTATPLIALLSSTRADAPSLPPHPSPPRLHHPSSPPSSLSQPLLPRPDTCSVIPATPSPPPTTRSLAPPPVRSSAPLPHLRPSPSSFIPPPSPPPLPRGWPCVLRCPPVPPDNGPPRRRAPRVPAGADGVCVIVRLSPPVLRMGPRRLRESGDNPAGFA